MRRFGARWLLLCLLLLGIVSMHHVVPASAHDAMPAATSMAAQSPMPAPTHEPDSPAPSHDLMHLCMAVLCAILGLLLIALLLTVLRWETQPVPSLRSSTSRVDRPPGLSGRTLLASLCVLRL
jgi:hypothetical protein